MLKLFRIWLIDKILYLLEKLLFDRKLIKFYKNKNLNSVIDVGANIGQSIDLFLKINPQCKILAFEPNPSLFQKLIIKYKNNSNIKLFQLGISNTEGSKTFYENVLHTTSSFEELDLNSKYLKSKSKILGVNPEEIVKSQYPVKVTTLAKVNEETQLQIDVLKIDTEGHEFACLEGLFNTEYQQNIKYIQFEYHNDDMYKQKISLMKMTEILNANNYQLELTIKHQFGSFVDLIFKKT